MSYSLWYYLVESCSKMPNHNKTILRRIYFSQNRSSEIIQLEKKKIIAFSGQLQKDGS